jgi:hypothetical protein
VLPVVLRLRNQLLVLLVLLEEARAAPVLVVRPVDVVVFVPAEDWNGGALLSKLRGAGGGFEVGSDEVEVDNDGFDGLVMA